MFPYIGAACVTPWEADKLPPREEVRERVRMKRVRARDALRSGKLGTLFPTFGDGG